MRKHLKPLELYTLLALAQGPLHGYGLATQIERDSSGELKPLPGNLYVVLRRLEDRGMVEREEESSTTDRRRTYALTQLGRRRLTAEAERLAEFARAVATRFGEPVDQGEG